MIALVPICLGVVTAYAAIRRDDHVLRHGAAAALLVLGVALCGRRLGMLAGIVEAVWMAALAAIVVGLLAGFAAVRR